MSNVELYQVQDAADTLMDGLNDGYAGYSPMSPDVIREVMVEAGIEGAQEQAEAARIWLSDIGGSTELIRRALQVVAG